MAVCTGCSLLCEDIEVALKAGGFDKVKNLCRKGHSHFQTVRGERTGPVVDGQEVSQDQAIERAAEILKDAKRPLLLGWANTSLEAQSVGIDLARKLGATIDDASPFCQGLLMERVLTGKLPTCTLDDVRNFADVSLYWGSDPSNSHPRHLSRFAYYPRGSKRQKSYEEERTMIVVDVRRSSTVELADMFFQVLPGGDADFIAAVTSVLDGKIPKFGDKKRMIELGKLLKKTEFGAVFPGPGLVQSLGGKMDHLDDLLERLNQLAPFKVIPVVGHYNARGFNQLLLDQTGFVNQVSFAGDKPAHGPECSVVEAARSCDACLVIGSDPLSSLPFGTAGALSKLPTIAIDPCRTLTTDAASVVIPSAMYGLEAGGSALRMDGVKVGFEPILETDLPPDEEILRRLLEAV